MIYPGLHSGRSHLEVLISLDPRPNSEIHTKHRMQGTVPGTTGDTKKREVTPIIRKAKEEENGTAQGRFISISRILNKAYHTGVAQVIMTDIYEGDKGNTKSNITRGSLWLVS